MTTTKFIGLVGLSILVLAAPAGVRGAGPDLRLLEAVQHQDKVLIRALIQQHVDVNTARADGVTPLLWAVHLNDAEVTSLLLAAGAKVNAADDHGLTPLAQACENLNPGVVDKLLAAGADPNLTQSSGLTPLMMAVHTGSLDIVKKLLARGADVNRATTKTGDTALMWAIGESRSEIARALLATHADIHASSASGLTPLMFAARNGDIEMAKSLLAAGVGVNEMGSDRTHPLPFAIQSGQPQFALFLLDQGADPNGEMGGVRAMHLAAGNASTWLADWSRRHGGGGGTLGGGGPLFGGGGRMTAADRVTLVNALIAKGADPNARTTSSAMFMSYIGFPTKGAFEGFSTGTGDLRGATALWIAAYDANGSSVGGFVVDVEAAPAAVAAAAAAAAAGNNVAPVAAQPGSGRGAAGAGGRGGIGGGGNDSTAIARALLAGGADLRLTTDDGTTPLMAAAGLGRATFQPGLQRGRRAQGAEEMVKFLIDAGADVNAVNEGDFQAIHGAAFRGLDEVIQILVERGANINARDYRGRTPYRLAEGSKQSFQFQAYPETAEFIKRLGANTRLGIPGAVQERNRDLSTFAANQKP